MSVRRQSGQATVELIGAVPVVLVLGLLLLQLLAVGYASVLAGGAAEAGALAIAGGGDSHAAVRGALPGWSRARAHMSMRDGRVVVRLRPPSPLRALARRLEVTGRAAVEAR
jgi:hypothetical protein